MRLASKAAASMSLSLCRQSKYKLIGGLLKEHALISLFWTMKWNPLWGSTPSELTKGLVLDNLWTTEIPIGKGAFGEIWQGVNKSTGDKVAIKFEPVDVQMPQLPIEFILYEKLKKCEHIPKIHGGGKFKDKWHYIVMECMSASLEKLFNNANHHFTKKTCIQLMIQMLKVIEEIHDAGVIHRDIKPDNFMFGRKENGRNKVLCMIDFGLGKEYLDAKGRHIAEDTAKFALGTARYMPIHAHQFVTQSRRDDLEAIGFVCIYFLNGTLPWQSIDADNKLVRNQKIEEMKGMKVAKLCQGHPVAFAEYFRRVRSLLFAQRPDYNGLRSLFTTLARKKNIRLDYVYDWEL